MLPKELDTPIANAYKEQGMNAEMVAKKLGLSVTYVYELARGHKSPSLAVAGRLCQLLHKRPEDLFPDVFLTSTSANSGVGMKG